jgi:hypothetical protein
VQLGIRRDSLLPIGVRILLFTTELIRRGRDGQANWFLWLGAPCRGVGAGPGVKNVIHFLASSPC